MNKLLFFLIVAIPLAGYCQQGSKQSILGEVKDVQNQIVAMASVKNISDQIETKTDQKGRFNILVSVGDTLEFTSIGFKSYSTVFTEGMKFIEVTLEPNYQQIEEVEINTGYQQLRPNEINGAVTIINEDKLRKQVGTNILQRLDGVTSGLTFQVGKENTNPQNKTGITIRGYSTINGPLDPLIVLDNFVYDGD